MLFQPLIFPSKAFRLQNVSKTLHGQRLIQQSNRAVERCWTQVHVGAPQMPMIAERRRESDRERHKPPSHIA
jgi:hypothetical protein